MYRRTLRILSNCQWFLCMNRMKLHTSWFPAYSRHDKDLPNPAYPVPLSKALGPDSDILLDQLRKSKSLDRILELVNSHLNVMNSKHVVMALEHIHILTKDNMDASVVLLENPVFQSLCARLMKVIRLFEPQEVITTYKVLSGLKIRNQTFVMQSVLKMIGAHINNMTLGQLVFLSFLLHKQPHYPLVDGLKLALPLVLQVQIDQQLDSDKITEVVNCLQLACRARLKPVTIQKIIDVLLEKASVLSPDDALTAIFSLLNLDIPVNGYKELTNTAFNIVAKNLDSLSQNKVLTLIKTCRVQDFYHSKLFFTVADHIVSKKWNFECTYSALTYFSKLDFYPANLLDYFAEVLCAERELFESNNFYSPLNCAEYLTVSSYQPVRADEALRILYSHEAKIKNFIKKSPNLVLKFLSCLAMFGHFPHILLSDALDEDFLFSAWSASKKQGRAPEFEQNVLALVWALEVYDEQKNFSFPITVLNKLTHLVYQRHLNSEYPLSRFIENGLGGSQFLQSGVFTHDGHVIDHIVAMRTGNYPVSLKSAQKESGSSVQNLTYVEDYILPEDAKIVAIIVAKAEHYLRDPEILKSWMNMKVRSLAKKNYSTVVINYAQWRDLPDREKIPFLMREIKQAAEDNHVLKSTYV